MRLSDILASGGARDDLKKLWDQTEAAGEMGPIPAGEYIARIVAGDYETSRTKGTPGYRLTFEVLEGAYAGRRLWHDCWLTPAALPGSKRDLAKLGVTSLDQLDSPLPRWIRCRCQVALRRDDAGIERNRVKCFEVIGLDKPEEDPFAPVSAPSEPTGGPPAGLGKACENSEEVDAHVPF